MLLRLLKAFLVTQTNSLYVAMFYILCIVTFRVIKGTDSSSLTNVALHKPTAQGPGTYGNAFPHDDPTIYTSCQAVDGIESTNHVKCTHTHSGNPMWWMVDLQATYQVHSVAILNRDVCSSRLQNFTVDTFLEDPRTVPGFPGNYGKICSYRKTEVGASQWVELDCDSTFVTGRFLRVIKWGYEHLTLCEVRYNSRLQLLQVFLE